MDGLGNFIRSDLLLRVNDLYQKDVKWCLEAGCVPHADVTSYINFLLFKFLEEEEDFFRQRDSIKSCFTMEDLRVIQKE